MLKKRLLSFKYAFMGLGDLIRHQPNARIHLLATVLVLGAGFWVDLQPGEWALVALAISLVWAGEAFNTALEYLTDLVSPDFHPLAGKAKDAAAAAVLISAAKAVAIGLLVFIPHL
jgi:diacylglycerol kinase